MIKWPVKYVDYNGVERDEVLWFHLNEAELMEMQMTTTGGYAEMIEKATQTQDGPTVFRIFKDMLLLSYGEKTPDGRGFEKSPELRKKFENSKAYSVIAMELLSDNDKAVKFANGVIPADIADKVNQNGQPSSTHPALK